VPLPELEGIAVLVTGGAGFIGSHLVDALLERGARVRVVDDLSSGRVENLRSAAGALELVEGDIRDLATCARACRGARYVFHQAARGSVPRSLEDPATTVGVNVAGTANVFAAARDAGVARLVYASSSSVYGDSARLPKREGEEGLALSPYALSKVMDEELAEHFHRVFGLRVLGLRYFNVYGPRQSPEGPYAAAIPRFFAAALAGSPMEIHGDGEQTRDFTWIGDAVTANLLAAGAPDAANGRAFNVGGGQAISVNRLAAAVAAAVGDASSPPRHVAPRPGDPRHSLADLARATQVLGYRPTVGVEEGLSRTRAAHAERPV
jgi:nucleoside-diphosphate-sugar epimerase